MAPFSSLCSQVSVLCCSCSMHAFETKKKNRHITFLAFLASNLMLEIWDPTPVSSCAPIMWCCPVISCTCIHSAKVCSLCNLNSQKNCPKFRSKVSIPHNPWEQVEINYSSRLWLQLDSQRIGSVLFEPARILGWPFFFDRGLDSAATVYKTLSSTLNLIVVTIWRLCREVTKKVHRRDSFDEDRLSRLSIETKAIITSGY